MSTVREAAHASRTADHVGAARDVLASVLSPFDVTGWDALDVLVTADLVVVVFAAPDVDDTPVHFAVHLPNVGDPSVTLVKDDDGWTDLGAVTSLSQLDEILPTADPVDAPEPTYPAWATGVAYKVGDKVTYGGFTWQCVSGHTSQAGWTPDAVPALWTKVAA